MGPPGLPKLLVPFLPGRKDTKSKACLGSCSLAETGHLGGQILARCGRPRPSCPPPHFGFRSPDDTLCGKCITDSMWLGLPRLMPSDPAPHPSVSLATQPRALAWLWGGGAGLHMESSVGLEEPVLVGTVQGVSWRAMEQALHWEGLRAQQARQEGRWERGAPGLLHAARQDWAFGNWPCWHPGSGEGTQSSGPPRINRTAFRAQSWGLVGGFLEAEL